jgi:hypothetical protein
VRRADAAAGLVAAGLVAAGLVAPAAAAPTTPTGSARLQGSFLLNGRITAVSGVRGERRGQRFQRTWTFNPTCPSGACAFIGLIRARAGGTDRLTLRRRSPGVYIGSGRFFAPLRCAGQIYARGESVPFSVTVNVTSAAVSNGALIATGVSATYASRSRTNLTPCVRPPAREAASYTGQLIPGTS